MNAESTQSPQGGPAPQYVELPLVADVTAPGSARAFVRERWPELTDGVLDDVTLIVSELVSNAVKHGRPDISLRMRVKPFAVDVSVLDHGPRLEVTELREPQLDAPSGRGLTIVDRLAMDWGVDPLEDGTGKYVWARLDVETQTS